MGRGSKPTRAKNVLKEESIMQPITLKKIDQALKTGLLVLVLIACLLFAESSLAACNSSNAKTVFGRIDNDYTITSNERALQVLIESNRALQEQNDYLREQNRKLLEEVLDEKTSTR